MNQENQPQEQAAADQQIQGVVGQDVSLCFYLVAGQIRLRHKTTGAFGETPVVNAILTTLEPFITVSDLGRANQGLQNVFSQKASPEVLQEQEIVDVVINTIAPLGFMTEAQFQGGSDPVAEAQQIVEQLQALARTKPQ